MGYHRQLEKLPGKRRPGEPPVLQAEVRVTLMQCGPAERSRPLLDLQGKIEGTVGREVFETRMKIGGCLRLKVVWCPRRAG